VSILIFHRLMMAFTLLLFAASIPRAALAEKPIEEQEYTSRLEQGIQFYSDNKFEEAAAGLESLTETNPNNKEAFLWLAQAESHLQNWNSAREAFRRYSELAPRDAQGPRGVGKTYEAEGNTTLALMWYRRAQDIEPANAEIAAALKRVGQTQSQAAPVSAPSTPQSSQPAAVKPQPASPHPVPAAAGGFWQVGLAGVLGARTVWWGRLIVLVIFVFTLLNGSHMQGKTMVERMPEVPNAVLLALSAIAASMAYVLWWGIPDGWRWGFLAACVLASMGGTSFAARQAR
jgi:tetratricopeptide (TPR) repeat protein